MRQAARQVTRPWPRCRRPRRTSARRSERAASALVSADGRSALVTFDVPGPQDDQATAVAPALRAVAAVQAQYPGLRIAEGGDASYARAINSVLDNGFRQAEATSVPITLVLLLLVFGALVAAGIPLLLAITSVMVALSLLTVISQWLPVGSSTSEVVLLIGMAVGIDYSLFYLRREREERASGATTGEALRTAAATSGRAILVSGLTVMIALAGLFLSGYDVFTGIALGTIAVVGVAVLGSLTVLPALLSWLGPRADRGRIPFLGRRRTAARPSRVWAALVRRVVRRPLLWGGAAAIALLALAAPALGHADRPARRSTCPPAPRCCRPSTQIPQAFPQSPSPAQVVVTGKDLHRPGDAGRDRRAAGPGGRRRPGARSASPSPPPRSAGGRGPDHRRTAGGERRRTPPRTTPCSPCATRSCPRRWAGCGGISYAVAGDTAGSYDDVAAMHSATPEIVAFVVLLAFVLLLVAFRSVTIPLVSIALNLLSVGAGYGLITLIFQDGRLQGLLGYTSFGGIISGSRCSCSCCCSG